MTVQSVEWLQELVSKMELHEKLSMLAGQNLWETVPIDRLQIPSLKVSDGPNGARGGDFLDGATAACFPAGVSLASTFNRSLAQKIGHALGEETLTKGAHVLLGPTACIQRSPLGGRNFESFSEDPLLTGVVAANYVKGLQSNGVAATLKHFVANEQETGRLVVDETISERAMREIYLKPFEIVVKQADPWCIMTSYPKVNGHYMDSQSTYIQDVLRNEWHFDGLVMSDWGGTTNSSLSVKYGLDLEMPGPARHRKPAAIEKALNAGLITVRDIDSCILSQLKLLRKTRKFTDRRETPAEQAINRPEHRALIRKAGAEGIVLLKNERGMLPFDLKRTRKIALIGPLAKEAAAHGGGSASMNCHYKITPWDAFHQRLGGQVELSHAKGAHVHRNLPDLEHGTKTSKGSAGLTALYFKSEDCCGEAFYTEELKRGLFTNMMKEGGRGAKSVRISTTYTPSASGKHYISFSGAGPSKLSINGELVSHQRGGIKDPLLFLLGLQSEHQFQVAFEASKSYEIVIETRPSPKTDNDEVSLFDDQISAHVGLMLQSEMEQDLLGEAVDAATAADLAICFVGNTPRWESEGEDMASMALPANGSQDRLIAAVTKANPNTIVVNMTGVPVETPWLNNVAAFVQAWFAGQESGNAILDVLLGEVSPSGKLPVSWPRRIEHTPCYGNFGSDSAESRQVEYKEGVNVGYRHYDRQYDTEREVLFPFGYGLSYTTFEVSDAKLSGTLSTGSTVEIEVTVTNSGAVAGAETVQIYLAPPATSTKGRPPKALISFEKVFLQPGESKIVAVTTEQDVAAFWEEETHCWAVESGRHTILVATSSHPQDVKAELHVDIASAYTYSPVH